VSVLVDRDILEAIDSGQIIIEPFDRMCLGTNSYDVHLSSHLRVYQRRKDAASRKWEEIQNAVLEPLDVREARAVVDFEVPEDGLVLQPGRLYLASTVEYTESIAHVPMLNGRSSLGRLGLSIHVTAGTGDVGFRGHWTMELVAVEPIRVYAGISIGQLLWLTASDVPLTTYDRKLSAKYNRAGELPQSSRLHLELGRGPKDG
jgi:dCTP deaminase